MCVRVRVRERESEREKERVEYTRMHVYVCMHVYIRMHVCLHAASPSVARSSVTRVVRRDRGVLELRHRRLATIQKSAL